MFMLVVQDWYHRHKPSVNPQFHPYVPGVLVTSWYKEYELEGRAGDMWSMWFIYYMHMAKVFCVYSNLGVYNADKESCLCINRREIGLHNSNKGPENMCRLLNVWREEFVVFPKDVVRRDWDGTPLMDTRHRFLRDQTTL